MRHIVGIYLLVGFSMLTGCSRSDNDETDTLIEGATVKQSKENIQTNSANRNSLSSLPDTKDAIELGETRTSPVPLSDQLNVPVLEIKRIAMKLDSDELTAYAVAYQTAITDQESKRKELTLQIKELSMTEVVGTRGKEIKEQLAQGSRQLRELEARQRIYLDQLTAKKGDTL